MIVCVCLGVVHRHEIAEAAGLISQAFGTEEVDRHIVLFKKVSRSSESNEITGAYLIILTCDLGVSSNRS